MTAGPDRWRRVAELFDRAADLAGAERAALLDRECDDAGLRAEVEALLASHETEHPLFVEGAAARAAPLLAEGLPPAASGGDSGIGPEGLGAGAQVDRWRIVSHLGRGGMGNVFLAERADGEVRQRAALKLLRREFEGPEVVARFRRERQILANLDHPGIARLLDAGTAPNGQPYLALEHVEGEPITAWCDRQRAPVEERLRLFLEVCDAVDTAHRRLIVHRDLKPSNVLVTRQGKAKLLDFGIAKLLEPGPEDEAGETATLGRVLTPEYAAPEQFLGQPVTTATDVYGLGVLLYELLCGRRPHHVERSTPVADAARELTTEAPRPSTVVRDGAAAAGVAAARRLSTLGLASRLRGDLDAIVSKALRPEPEARYRSAAALADDVRRHLDGYPVSARAGSLRYRTGRFLRRYRAAVAAAAAVLLALVGGLAAALLESRQTAREARRAQEVQRFLVDLFRESEPAVSKGEAVTAREILTRGAQRIETELAAEPEVQAELLATVAEINLELGRYDEAVPLAEKAVALRRRHPGREAEQLASALDGLARALVAKEEVDRAEQLHQEALALRRRRAAESPGVARSLLQLSDIAIERGDPAAGVRLAREALAMARATAGAAGEDVTSFMNTLANHLQEAGEYPEAERLHAEVLALRLERYGPDHPDVATAHQSLGVSLDYLGRLEEAVEQYSQALALRRKLLGDNHPYTAHVRQLRALTLENLGRHEEAERELDAAIAVYRATLGEKSRRVAQALNDRGVQRYRLGDYGAAATTLREALDIYREDPGPKHNFTIGMINNLGMISMLAGDYAGAEALLREALALRREVLGKDHPQVALSLDNLGRLLTATGRASQAIPLHREAEAIYLQRSAADTADVGGSRWYLAEALAEVRPGEAEAPYRAGLADLRRAFPEGGPRLERLLTSFGAFLLERGAADEAAQLLREALDYTTSKYGAADWRTAEVQVLLGSAPLRPNPDEAQEARAWLTAGRRYFREHPEAVHRLRPAARRRLV